jgi:hypothetical protein
MAASIHCTCTPDNLCDIHKTLQKAILNYAERFRQASMSELQTTAFKSFKVLNDSEKCTCTELYFCPVCRSKDATGLNEELWKTNHNLRKEIARLREEFEEAAKRIEDGFPKDDTIEAKWGYNLCKANFLGVKEELDKK